MEETASRPRRAIRPRLHLEGGFPSNYTASWCVDRGGLHQRVTATDLSIEIGGKDRPLRWSTADLFGIRNIKDPTLLPSEYLLVRTRRDLAPHLHDTLRIDDFANLDPPPLLSANLYPYQLAGYTKILSLVSRDTGAFLFDEMGLGKTVQVIAVLLAEAAKGPSLVVAPASLLTNWARELASFAPTLRVMVHSGPGRAGVTSRFESIDVVVVGYETVVNDAVFMKDYPWNLLVLDEAQRIKNPDASRSTALKAFRSRAKICVTGTPIENSLADLWSLSEAVLPQLLGDLERFRSGYPDDTSSASALGAITSPLTVRRAVSEVATDLPPLSNFLVPIDMDTSRRALYEREAAENPGLPGATRRRLIAAHAEEEAGQTLLRTAKGEFLLERIGEVFARNEKALIFTSYQRSLDLIASAIRNLWSSAYVETIDGRTQMEERQSMIDEFSRNSSHGVLLLNPVAAGVGLNITAANHVFHFNPEWNPALTKQATARSYRRKQERPVFVYHLYYEDSIESDVISTAEFKSALAGAVRAGHEERKRPS